MIVALLNLIGLALTVAAAFVMWYFPPRMKYFTEDGAQVVTWTNNPNQGNACLGRMQARLSKWAPFILGVGFLLQLPAAIVAVCSAN